jgi:phytol kinase
LSDGLPLLLSFAWVAVVVGIAEVLRRDGRVSFDVSRKIIHIGIGSWILPTVLLFHSRWMAAAPPALFTLVNLLSLRFRWTKSMDAEAGSNAGTVWFPLSFTVLLLVLWGVEGGRTAVCAGLLALAWGDAAAALVGRRWGRHRYRTGDGWRSFEGSAAMLLFSLAAIIVAGRFVGSSEGLAPYGVARVLAGAVAATFLEAAGRRGFDNFLVPVGTAMLLWGLGRIIPMG